MLCLALRYFFEAARSQVISNDVQNKATCTVPCHVGLEPRFPFFLPHKSALKLIKVSHVYPLLVGLKRTAVFYMFFARAYGLYETTEAKSWNRRICQKLCHA